MILNDLRHKARLPTALKIRNRNIRNMIPFIMVSESNSVFQMFILYDTTY